jgi:hypothetical protein
MITVAIPLYRSHNIAWIAMESLINQIDAPKFEVIILQEEEDMFDPKPFFDRMRKEQPNLVNTANIVYNKYEPLGNKWVTLAELALGEQFLLLAGDSYANPYRLAESWEHKEYDWIHSEQGLYYSITSGRTILFRKEDRHLTSLNMAAKTMDVRTVMKRNVRKGVDGWLFSSLNPKSVYLNTSDSWKKGLEVHHFMNLSAGRTSMFFFPRNPYHATSLKPDIPEYIMEKLKTMTKNCTHAAITI